MTQSKLRLHNVCFQKLSPRRSSRLVGRMAKYSVSMRFLRRKSFLLSAAVGNGGVTTNAIRSLALSSRCCKIWCNGVKCCLNMLFSVKLNMHNHPEIMKCSVNVSWPFRFIMLSRFVTLTTKSMIFGQTREVIPKIIENLLCTRDTT